MKMLDKNGKLTIIAKAIFDSNMERLRAGDDPIAIAKSLMEQTKIVEYNGSYVQDGILTLDYYRSFKNGWYHWVWKMQEPITAPKTIPIVAISGRMSKTWPIGNNDIIVGMESALEARRNYRPGIRWNPFDQFKVTDLPLPMDVMVKADLIFSKGNVYKNRTGETLDLMPDLRDNVVYAYRDGKLIHEQRVDPSHL